MVEYFMGHQVK